MVVGCKASNSPTEYPSSESKQDIKEYAGSNFNPIFKEWVQGQKFQGGA